MNIRIKWHAFYSALPVRPARFQNWMTPLSIFSTFIAFLPALTLMLNIFEEKPSTVWFVTVCFFSGAFLFAYDQKWATYNARRAGLTKNKWTHIKDKDQ